MCECAAARCGWQVSGVVYCFGNRWGLKFNSERMCVCVCVTACGGCLRSDGVCDVWKLLGAEAHDRGLFRCDENMIMRAPDPAKN